MGTVADRSMSFEPGLLQAGTLNDLGQRLQTHLSALLEDGGDRIRRPTELSRAWGLEQTLCTRLFQAFREPDALLALTKLPAPSTLRLLIQAAEKANVDATRIANAQASVGELQHLITDLGGSKANLDTLVARRSHHARQKVEQSAKQAIHRGMSNLLGVQAEALVAITFVFPGKEDGWCDELAVHGYHRLVRFRPERELLIATRETLHEVHDPKSIVLQSLHGDGIQDHGCVTALKRFCTSPFPDVKITEENGKILYSLPERPDELPHEIDLIFASIERKGEPLFATKDHARARYAVVPQNPCKHLIYDIYVHRDVWRGVEPELHLLRQGDPAAENLAAHSLDRVDFVESLENLGTSPAAIPTPTFDRHFHLIEDVQREMNWTSDSFRLYRCAVRYPVVGLWYSVQFPLPAAD